VPAELQLTGTAAGNQNIATSQTTGTLTIGGENATGITNIGSSGNGRIELGYGITPNRSNKIINIGGGSGTKTITLGGVVGGTSTFLYGAFTTSENITVNGSTIGSGSFTDLTNIAFGKEALVTNVLGIKNTAIGYQALTINREAEDEPANDNNTAVGYRAGWTNSQGSNSTYIGSGATGTGSNEIVIGASATALGGGDNTVTIGSGGTVSTKLFGKIIASTYTIATLPTGTTGSRSFVTNHRSATAYPIFGEVASATGTFGTFNVPVFYDGTNWRVG
jgi:hypothetical protein